MSLLGGAVVARNVTFGSPATNFTSNTQARPGTARPGTARPARSVTAGVSPEHPSASPPPFSGPRAGSGPRGPCVDWGEGFDGGGVAAGAGRWC